MPAKLKYTEQRLVALLNKRDQDAFIFLYDTYSPALYGIALKIVGSQETAQKVLQESFVKIQKSISSYSRRKGKLFAWLLNIVKQVALTNKSSAQPKTGEEKSLLRIKYPGLETIGKKLKNEQVSLIDAVYFKGLGYDAVSKEFKIPPENVTIRIRSAVTKLRESLS